MKLEDLRGGIREHAQRRQSAWMSSFDAAIAAVADEQRAKGKLHTAVTAETYAKAANTLLSDVGNELATWIVERLTAEGKGSLSEDQVLAEFAATMKFGRDRLASKLLKSIESLGLRSAGEGTEGLSKFKRVQSYEPGESKLKVFFGGNPMSRGGKPLSDWKQSKAPPEASETTPTRVWFVVLVICIGIVLGSGIWLFAELY